MNRSLLTRADWLSLARKLCEPILSHYDAACSTVTLTPRVEAASYSDHVADMETFARPLWAAAGLVHAGDTALGQTILAMIRRGVDPDDDAYWGDLAEGGQLIVETSALLWFLFLNRDLMRATYDETDLAKLRTWFLRADLSPTPANNWLLFLLFVHVVFEALGLEEHSDKAERLWAAVDALYAGEGWYHDKFSKQFDYYNAFGFHFFSLLCLAVAGRDALGAMGDAIVERAESFAQQFRCFFDANGAAVPYGRSLTYRFAQAAFWSACQLAGLPGVSAEESKGLICRHLQYWLTQDVFRADGALSVGYAYENTGMREFYNATGSPYFAMTVFVLLALPYDHPFWAVNPAPPPADFAPTTLAARSFLAMRSQGMVSLFPANVRPVFDWGHILAKYEKLQYSSRHGFCVFAAGSGAAGSSLDATVSVSYDGIAWIPHHKSQDLVISSCTLFSRWSVDRETTVLTRLYLLGDWHIRVQEVTAKRPLQLSDGGLCVPADARPLAGFPAVTLGAEAASLYTAAIPLLPEGRAETIFAAENTSLLFRDACIPCVFHQLSPGKSIVVDAFYGAVTPPRFAPRAVLSEKTIQIDCGEKSLSIKL